MIKERREKKQILIVDDELIVAQDICGMLESHGFGVTSIVSSGKDAIKKAKLENPDLIIMDINLHGEIDGIEAADHIHKHNNIPVIYLTAYMNNKMQERAMITGPSGYITKPLKERDLISNVEIALQQDATQKALAQNEEMFRNIIENNADGIIIVNADGVTLFVNPSAEAMFCRSADSMVGGEFGFPVIEGKSSEIEIIRAGLDPISVEIRAARTLYDGKRAYLISLRDITERKMTETEVKRQRAHIQSIFEYSLEGMVILDLNKNVINANRGFKDLFGYGIEEIRQKSIDDIMTGCKENPNAIDKAAMEQGFRDYERVRHRKDGGIINVSVSGGPIIVDKTTEGFFVIYRDISRQKEVEQALKRNLERLLSVFESTVQSLATTVEMRDPYTAGHQRRVMRLACAIAKKMHLPEATITGIRIASSIHDIGKICIPAEILSKPSKLNQMEYDLIKSHSDAGYEMLKSVDFPWPIAEIVHQHHERLNKTGYPQGLDGNHILQEAKVIAVADVVEAMGSHRPYRPSLGIEEALKEIKKGSNLIYDERIVRACIELFDEGFELESDVT
jgi:PAS domain S-box-containing protein